MTLYDSDAIQRLKDKLDYEIWMLNLLDSIENHSTPDSIEINNKDGLVSICMSFETTYGFEYAKNVIVAFMPLIFCASYKILDMIYEWILEENSLHGIIGRVPWRFSEKLRLIDSTSYINYPPLFCSNIYMKDYSLSFFTKLLDYRNEVIHNKNFSITENNLLITDSKTGDCLTFDKTELFYLTQLMIIFKKCLTNEVFFSDYYDALTKYYFDQLKKIHQLPVFGKKEVHLLNINLTVPKENNIFPANIKLVREKVRERNLNQEIFFNLTIIAEDEKNIVAKWFFPVESLPIEDIFNLTLDLYPEFRLAL